MTRAKTAATSTKGSSQDELHWVSTTSGYELSLSGNKVVCRSAAGKRLNAVPATLKDDPVAVDLRGLAEWLVGHEKECRERVETWMLRSLPVPTALLSSVWPDIAWRSSLQDCTVAVFVDDAPDMTRVGLLRDVFTDPANGTGVGVVDLDGNTKRWNCHQIVIPHPVLLKHLDDWREFAAELGINQQVPQLFRETHDRPELADGPLSISTYQGGRYQQLRHIQGRASSHGFSVSGGFAVCRIFEGGQMVEARLWIGSDSPDYETEIGDLVWVDSEGRQLFSEDVGPVAWSEGHRMGADLYAGRVIDQTVEQQ
jgi:hypothetical protein